MSEILDKYDENGNGQIDPHELALIELEDRRRKMEDDDAQRDQQRKMIWYVLFGMLGYPLFVLGASIAGVDKAADLIASMATIYFPSTSLLVGVFFGAEAMKKNASAAPPPAKKA
jgi:hypothetical protein